MDFSEKNPQILYGSKISFPNMILQLEFENRRKTFMH